jgi:hypothetical protein
MGASHFPILRNALGADSCTISCTCAVISLSLETSGMDAGVTGTDCATGATMGSTRTSSFTSSTTTVSFIDSSATCSRAAASSSTLITTATSSSSSSSSSACTSTTSTGVFGIHEERKGTITIRNWISGAFAYSQ